MVSVPDSPPGRAASAEDYVFPPGQSAAHPAKFSEALFPVFASYLASGSSILDPFAGSGRVHLLEDEGLVAGYRTIGVEIEPEWAALHPRTVVGDATCLPFPDGSFDAVVTSPTYANRLADSHIDTSGRRRNSYSHNLRALVGDPYRRLHPRNTGTLKWESRPQRQQYESLHRAAWAEVARVLSPGGTFLLNISDMARFPGQVTGWHRETVASFGFELEAEEQVPTPRLRHGANRERADHELVMAWRKPGADAEVPRKAVSSW